MENLNVQIGFLADHPELAGQLAQHFKGEWPDHFAAFSLQEIEKDFLSRAGRETLPVVLVAWIDGKVVGTIALAQKSIESFEHLGPWLKGLYVGRAFRRQGIGRCLIEKASTLAGAFGFQEIYAGTEKARRLLQTLGWMELQRIPYHGQDLSVMKKLIRNGA